jgi:hypothetical protein
VGVEISSFGRLLELFWVCCPEVCVMTTVVFKIVCICAISLQ